MSAVPPHVTGDHVPLPGDVGPSLPPRSGRRRGLNLRIVAVLVALIVLGGYLLYAIESTSTSILQPVTTTPSGPPFPTPIHHVIVLMMEDQAVADVLAFGPYERYLAETYGFASQFYGLTHDSLANYEDAISGTTTSNSTLDQSKNLAITYLIDRAGLTWASYSESMPSPCALSNATSPTYTTDHNPFVHYLNITANSAYCATHVLNLTGWQTSLTAGDLPNYVWVAPNTTNDDHQCSKLGPPSAPGCIPHGDLWLRNFLSPFINSSAFSNSVVLLTYDFNASDKPNATALVYFAAISPFAHIGYASSVPYDAYNLLTTAEWLLGLPSGKLHNDLWEYDQNPPMVDLFDFAPTYPVRGTILSLGGPPVIGAMVGGSGYHTQTNTSGGFLLPMPNGTYTFSASAGGQCPSSPDTFTITGAPVTLELRLSC